MAVYVLLEIVDLDLRGVKVAKLFPPSATFFTSMLSPQFISTAAPPMDLPKQPSSGEKE